MAAPVKSIEELQERVNEYARPRTPDDVSITSDGTRLDSMEKALAFLDELAREGVERSLVDFPDLSWEDFERASEAARSGLV